jgi:hypothetical protein
MKPRFFFLPVSLLLSAVLWACASAPPTATTSIIPSSAQAVATSRGPELEATDPATVSLASGQLQLVEFFRFT